MKLKCKKNDLLKGVTIVSKAVPSRTTMAILECILIDASLNKIKLTANDTELGIETKIEGEILEPGIIALDAKIFSEIIKNMPDDHEITIETEDSFKTIIRCEKTQDEDIVIYIIGKSGDDFSYLPVIEKKDMITISQFTLREMIRQTIFSVADNDNNKLMTGEMFEINENHLRVVSLDGHRISIRNIQLKESYESREVTVPGKTLNEISKILTGNADDMVDIFFSRNHIVFEFDNTTVVSRLIDGEYFKVDQMISHNYETKLVINKKELLNAIVRTTPLVKEGDKKPIIMDITDKNLELKISSFAGATKENLAIKKEGKDITIGFNSKFFMDALRVIDDESIVIYMVNPKSPCFIKDEEETYTYLILPVNFKNKAS